MGLLGKKREPPPAAPRPQLLDLLHAEDMCLVHWWYAQDRRSSQEVLMLMLLDLQKQIRELREKQQ